MMQQIKIISDGDPYKTQILNSDGVPIPGVISVKWEINKDMMGIATIEVYAECDLTGILEDIVRVPVVDDAK